MKIYLAFPITGKDFKDVKAYVAKMKARLIPLGYDVYHPLVGKDYLENEKVLKKSGYTQPLSTDHAIVARDLWMVKQSDVIFVNLMDAIVPPVGCIAEMAWAYYMHKHIILVYPDDDIHAFIKEMASVHFKNFDEAMNYLKKLIRKEI